MWIFELLWVEIIYRPIFNVLILFLDLFSGNLGLAIIALTLIVRGLLYKTSAAGAMMQSQMGDMQPKMQKIQDKYKDDPKKMQEEMMKLLKTQGAGPLKGCMGMLFQLPVFLGLFWVIRDYAQNDIPDYVYSFFHSFGQNFTSLDAVSTQFLGMDLLASWSLILTLLAAVLIFTQTKITMMAKPAAAPSIPGANVPDMSKMMWFMNVFLVFMMWSFVFSVESWVWLYIVVTTVFSVLQYTRQYRALLRAKLKSFLTKKSGKPEVVETK